MKTSTISTSPIITDSRSFLSSNSGGSSEPVSANTQKLSFQTLNQLPFNIRQKICGNILAGEDTPEKMGMLCRIPLVSSAWRSVADTHILSFYWNQLKETQLPELKALVERIDQECNSNKAEPEQPSSNAAEKSPLVNDLFRTRFIELNKELQKRGAPNPLDIPIRGILPATYEQTQRQMDDSLVSVWDEIQKKIDFNGAPVPEGAHEIRTWLKDPAHAKLIDQVTYLDLSNLGLTALPFEISNFHRLAVLDLKRNQLTRLPETIGNLSVLKRLNLEGNQLTSLPETVGKLQRLKELYLGGNQLTSLPETIGNLHKLTLLHLGDNQLTSFPETIGNLSELKRFYIKGNQLTSLPETIGNLHKLVSLSLEGNHLTTLPKTIGSLQRLELLYLAGNHLTTLPETIGNLYQLVLLDVGSNQLTRLPKTIGNLHELHVFFFGGNPLIFILDENLSKIICDSGHSEFKKVVERHSACMYYTCQSKLADLCQAIHCEVDDQTLQEKFKNLSDPMQELIRQAHSPSQPSGDILANRSFFTNAVIIGMKKKFDALSPEQKMLVNQQVWNLAGKPQGKNNLAEDLAKDNIIRLIDAMELVTSGGLL